MFDSKYDYELHGRILFTSRFILDKDIKNKIILDIGCGNGWFESNVLKRGAKKIIGIDNDENNLKIASDYLKSNKFIGKKSNALKLPLKECSADTITVWEVIEHLPRNSEEVFLKEAKRVLKENGVMYLSVPLNSFLSCILDPAWFLIGHRHYSLLFLKKLLKNTGLKINKVEVKGGIFELFYTIMLYLFKHLIRKNIPFRNWLNVKRDREFQDGKKGFANIFLKLEKANLL